MLDDNGIRPPVIAAGINLFGGPLGLIHRHVTGAIPIRRNTKDPAYLVTLKAYVAEVLRRHDLFFYIEGGRSYTGELKAPKTGLVHAALQAEVAGPVDHPGRPSPTTWCSRIASSRGRASSGASGRSAASWPRWSAPRSATARARSSRFGAPIAGRPAATTTRAATCSSSRTWSARASAGCYKVLPTALVAAAMRPSITPRDLEARIAELIDGAARARGANLGVTERRRRSWSAASSCSIDRAASSPSSAAATASATARCSATTRARIEHLLDAAAAGRGHAALMLDSALEGVLPPARREAAR